MDLNAVCKKILDVALPFSEYSSAPIAYICVSIGKTCPFSQEELKECFAKIKWDTDLSAAELSFTNETSSDSVALEVTEVVEFQDENDSPAARHKIQYSDGFIL